MCIEKYKINLYILVYEGTNGILSVYAHLKKPKTTLSISFNLLIPTCVKFP